MPVDHLSYSLGEPFFSILRSILDLPLSKQSIAFKLPIERRKQLLSPGISPEFAILLSLRPCFLTWVKFKQSYSPENAHEFTPSITPFLGTDELSLVDLFLTKLPDDFSDPLPEVLEGAKYELFEDENLLSESIKLLAYRDLLNENARNHLAKLYLYRKSNPQAQNEPDISITTYKDFYPYEEEVERFLKARTKEEKAKKALKAGRALLKLEVEEEEGLKRAKRAKREQDRIERINKMRKEKIKREMKKAEEMRRKEEAKKLEEEKRKQKEEQKKKKEEQLRQKKMEKPSKPRGRGKKGADRSKRLPKAQTQISEVVEEIPEEPETLPEPAKEEFVEITDEDFNNLHIDINRKNFAKMKEKVISCINGADGLVIDTEMTGVSLDRLDDKVTYSFG